ncbi:putative F-box protein At1g65770 [Phragmites australis]|uniref:putative F-box protein At1g65770 n=1 Tax=Phragmites australis TaxID=29695 RepID=UPI002D799051|nr:putative F-box protein At1g65770 [Phragmites australis]
MGDWTGLHEDLLLLVVGRLPALDLLRFRAVCASWRAAAAYFAARRGSPLPDRPWLLLPTDVAADHDRGRLIAYRDREVPVVTLPARLGRVNPRRFVPLGSARGAIVAADDRGEMHLLNLITGKRRPLPPVATLPLIDRVEGLHVHHHGGGVARIDGLIHKTVPVPTPGGGVMVVAIYRHQQHRRQWATARPGDRAWKSVAPTSIPTVVDVVVHKGQLYANTRYGMMYVFPELRGLGSASPEIIPSVTRRPSAYLERSFLVESPRGELMQVELLRPVAAAGGEGFVVRVLDECSETWEETEDIGDAAVLVDATGAVAASTADCPALRPNTVYFAVDLEGETRVWAYSLAGKHKRIEVVEALPTAEGYKPPCFWFAPVYSQP